VLNENFASAVFMLSAMSSAIQKLFGFKVEFKGGLVSDHATIFVNAFEAMFPSGPRGQLSTHIDEV
jgi:hypothetical protein